MSEISKDQCCEHDHNHDGDCHIHRKPLSWKENQRALTARAKMGRSWDRSKMKPGMILTTTGNSSYEVQKDGSFRRVLASPLLEKPAA